MMGTINKTEIEVASFKTWDAGDSHQTQEFMICRVQNSEDAVQYSNWTSNIHAISLVAGVVVEFGVVDYLEVSNFF